MPANNRIYYASQAVQLLPCDSEAKNHFGSWLTPQGLQSVGMTTNFNLEQVFQLGQLELYDNLEGVPEVEVTLNKVLDGTPPLYLMCTLGTGTWTTTPPTPPYNNGKELAELVNNRVSFNLGIWPDNVTAATGNPAHYVTCSGMYLSRFSYTLPVDGNATEEITLVGNNKVWNSGTQMQVDEFNPSAGKTPTAPNVMRRYSFDTGTVLPTGTAGIPIPSGRSISRPYVQTITISADLGREAINELGSFAPYCRYVNFPLEVTSEFEVIASDGDYVNADDFATTSGCGKKFTNLENKEVKVILCGTGTTGSSSDKLILDLGKKNKLTSVNYSGGDTGGGNATISYSFQTFNKFVMTAIGTFADIAYVDDTADTSFYS